MGGELFNIVTTRRFASVPEKVGKKMRDVVLEHGRLFSEKQQRHLKSDEWALNVYVDKGDAKPELDSDSDAEDENKEPPRAPEGKESKSDGEPHRHFAEK